MTSGVGARRAGRRGPTRHILVDGRTPINYVMVAPIVEAMAVDPRVRFAFTASDEPRRLGAIYPPQCRTRLVHPRLAALRRWDAYIASDFMWAWLPRGTCRIQTFHGVAGKYGFDAPTASLRAWDRLFFVNERRLRNCVRAGAIDPDSPATRLVGMPKVDCLVDGTYDRGEVLRGLRLDPARPTVLYAPTWSPASSLNAIGEPLVDALQSLPVNLVVKLHDRSLDRRERYSGGVDWIARLTPHLRPEQARLADAANIAPLLVAADVLITDHSSAGFEYLLLDRPIVRIERPSLATLANIHPDYIALLRDVSRTADDVAGVIAAVAAALADPSALSARRRAVAADLFYRAGSATGRAVRAVYEAVELESPVAHVQEASCLPSA